MRRGLTTPGVFLIAAIFGAIATACVADKPLEGRAEPAQPPAEDVASAVDAKVDASPQAGAPITLRGPVWAASWSPVPADVRHITPMIWVRPNTRPEVAARESRTKPPGRAVAFVWLIERDVATNQMDYVRTSDGVRTRIPGPWFDHGIRDVRSRMSRFFSDFRDAGGRLDYLVLDFEIGRGIWNYEADRREQSIQAVLADPRGREIREALLERGMREEDLGRIHDWRLRRPRYRLGVTDLTDAVKQARPAYIIWNAYMSERLAAALNQALFDPVQAVYPNVQGSNYNYFYLTPENVVPDFHGHLQYQSGHFGTHSSRSFYGAIGQLAQMQKADGTPHGDAPFDVLRWQVNRFRAIQRSSPTPMHAWVSHKSYEASTFRNNDYYDELIYHLALGGTETFLYWHPSGGGRSVTSVHDRDARILDRCLAQLNVWFDERERVAATLDALPWDSGLIASGMQIGDERILWRVTVPPGTRRIKVQETEEVLELPPGALGVWYESKAGALRSFVVAKSP